MKDGGSVLIPAFSIGRTQELLYELEGLIHEANDPKWRELAVVVDSPLAARFNAAYIRLEQLLTASDLVKACVGPVKRKADQLFLRSQGIVRPQ